MAEIEHDEYKDEHIKSPDIMNMLSRIVKQFNGVEHHIASVDQFTAAGMNYIIQRGFAITSTIKNKRVEAGSGSETAPSEIKFNLTFKKTTILPPAMRESVIGAPSETGKSGHPVDALYPHFARQQMRTYSNEIRVDADITATAYREHGPSETRTISIAGLRIGAIPCMVHSAKCNLYGKSRKELIMLRENPQDPGGYFIIRGQEHSVDCVENITINDMRITTDVRPNEDARAQVWSRYGDWFENSYQFIMRHHQNGAITIETQFFSLTNIQIPFHIFLRLITSVSDKEITEGIIGDITQRDPLTTILISMLNRAFLAPSTGYEAFANIIGHRDLVYKVGERFLDIPQNVLAQRDENVQRMVYSKMMEQVDTRVLPHLGILPEARMKKVRYIFYAIQKMFLTMLKILEPMDRDSLCNKRIHAAGISISKAFKTMFSHTVTTPIRHALTAAFENSVFEQVNLGSACSSAIRPDELESAMQKALTVGNTEMQVGRSISKNRVSSQARYLKNDMNGRAIANNISVTNPLANKQTDRAEQMRRAQPTYTGYIDMTQSADTGDKVGMNKQMAVSAIISLATSSENLKEAIKRDDDPDFFPFANVTTTMINSQKLSRVLVNGDWIGCVRNDWQFVAKWREYRRHGTQPGADAPPIDRHTSIVWDLCCREVRFWTDFGRMLRPLIIVYNNLREYNDYTMSRRSTKPVKFSQWTRLTPEIIHRFLLPDGDENRLKLDDLQNMGVIEYISADEHENMYLAQNLDELRANRHNVCTRYTHCDIEQAIHGMVILSAPLADHSYGIRTTYFGNQRKQSASWYDLAWPYRCDKKTMLQYYCEHPIVSTFADYHTCPNGQNCIVAFMIHGGFNQEDSVYLNADAVQRGLCNGLFFDYEMTICEPGEVFTMPDQSVVIDRHSTAVTDYLENGVARVGSTIKRDYVLINKVAVSPDGDGRRGSRDGMRVTDRSIIYSGRTPARILSVVRGEDDRKIPFIRVRYCQAKDAIPGDKVSSRQGNKGIIARIIPSCDMPVTESGLIPDVVINPQSIPTRRALNQLIEMVCGNDAAIEGFYMDATNSMPVDVVKITDRLKANGLPNIGYERMYNGTTGDWLAPTFVGISTYQRLEKFVENECRAVRHGPIDPLTHQPARGNIEKGALRMGEMELWTLLGHGAMRSLAEKIITDSDGTTTYICSRCGSVAIYNPTEELYNCKKCGQFARIVAVPTTWSSNIIRDEIRTLGIHMQYELEPHKFFVQDTK